MVASTRSSNKQTQTCVISLKEHMRHYRNAILKFSIAVVFAAAQAAAQPGRVPAEYQDLYRTLQGKIAAFENTVSGTWDGTKPPVVFSSELLSANANSGLVLLQPTRMDLVSLELSRLKSLGVKAVTMQIGFPILYSPFFAFNGDPNDYQSLLSFYQQVASTVHSQGLKLIVESGPLFPGVYSANSGLNLAGYYSSLSDQDYIAGRAQVVATIASQIQPDFLSVGSEPDTEAELTGKTSLGTPLGFANMINTFLKAISQAGGTGVTVGAGVGTWLQNGQSFVQSLGGTGINYIDLHIYPVNFGFLNTAVSLADTAHSLGKAVAMSEAWLLKERDSEFTTVNVASNNLIFSRDVFSFWEPLDQEFHDVLVKFAYWKELLFFSPFWSKYYYAYLDYNQYHGMTPTELIAAQSTALGPAIQAGRYSDTGLFYQNALSIAGPQATILSAAGYSPLIFASDSIVSIFGADLATGTGSATTTVPTKLAGTTATITDVAGVQQPLSLFFVSPQQVNAWIPQGLNPGPGVVRVTSADGVVSSSAVTLEPSSPGIFSANMNGQGVAAAIVVTVHGDGSKSFDFSANCGTTPGSCVGKAITLLPTERVVVELFGTGIRGRSSLSNVVATIGNATVAPAYASGQNQFVGLDQVNVPLPHTLAGQGQVNVTLTVDGVTSNTVTLTIQ